jgi:hypothetical protein
MSQLEVPKFTTYEEEAAFWDNLDTAPFMGDDGNWFHFETHPQRAIRIAILPELAEELIRMARSQGVSPETLVNVLLLERIQQMPEISSSKA